MIPLNIICYERGAAGVPSTTLPLPDLRERIHGYQHSISDRYGFESMSCSFPCGLDEGLDWLNNGLGRSVVVYGPDGQIVWEGYLETVGLTLGQKKASMSLSNVANRCRVFATTTGGTPANSGIQNNTSSQALYGIKERNQTMQKLSPIVAVTQANAAATTMLGMFAWPRSRESTEAKTGALGEISLDLTFAGWYSTLGWLTGSNHSSAYIDTGTQVINILASAAAVNAFLSTDTTQIITTGVTDSQYIVDGTYYTKKIEALLQQGNSTNQALTWGVYENRVMQVAVWAGATPTTIEYTEDASTGTVFDTYGNVVAPWDVRPNAMSQVMQLLDSGPPSGAVDAAARKYVGRVTCAIEGDSIGCSLEPSNTDSFEAFLASIRTY